MYDTDLLICAVYVQVKEPWLRLQPLLIGLLRTAESFVRETMMSEYLYFMRHVHNTIMVPTSLQNSLSLIFPWLSRTNHFPLLICSR